MFETILYTAENGIATITLNRPDRYNAFNNTMSFELLDALKNARKDDAVRVIILTGAGDKAFCSGQDLKDVAGAGSRSLGESVEKRYNPMIRLISEIEKPIIARVNGVAAGAGAGLAMACDLSVAADTASYLFAFVNIGLVLDSSSSYFLPRLVGKHRAFELATLGDKISATEAYEIGLVSQVVPFADLDATVNALAQKYTEKAPKAVGLIKKMLQRSTYSSLEQMLELEMYYQEIAGNSEDYKEGTTAFVEKRKPNFKVNKN